MTVHSFLSYILLRFSIKWALDFPSFQTTHSSVFQKHLLESHKVSECQQHVKDIPWDFLFVLPAEDGEIDFKFHHILSVPVHHLVGCCKLLLLRSNSCITQTNVWADWFLWRHWRHQLTLGGWVCFKWKTDEMKWCHILHEQLYESVHVEVRDPLHQLLL